MSTTTNQSQVDGQALGCGAACWWGATVSIAWIDERHQWNQKRTIDFAAQLRTI
jgi:hypothetical protein